MARVALFLLLCLLPVRGWGFLLEHFGTARGLLSNITYRCVRDRDGFIWICTDKGIQRYDGNSFQTFTVLNGLEDNDVFNLFEDRYGRLWCATFNGRPCFVQNGKVHNRANDTLARRLPVLPFINGVVTMPDGSLMMGYVRGQLLRVHPNGSHAWILDKSITYQTLYRIAADTGGLNVLASDCWLRWSRGKWTRTPMQMQQADSRAGILGYAQGDSVFARSPSGTVWRHRLPGLAHTAVIFVMQIGDHFFCSTFTGLYIIDMRSHRQWWVLRNKAVTSVEQDLAGDFWISTRGHGVYRLHGALEGVREVAEIGEHTSGHTGAGQVFLKSARTLHVLNKTGSTAYHQIQLPSDASIEPLYYDSSVFAYNDPPPGGATLQFAHRTQPVRWMLRSVYRDSTGRFVAMDRNTTDNFILVYDPKTNTSKYFPTSVRGRLSCQIGHRLFFYNQKILRLFNLKTEQLTTIDSFQDNTDVFDMLAIGGRLCLLASNGRIVTYQAPFTRASRRSYHDEHWQFRELASLRNGTLLAATNTDWYSLHFQQRPVLTVTVKRLEYPLPENTSELFTAKDSLYFVANDRLYAVHQNLLDQSRDTPRFLLNRIAINGRFYEPTDSVIRVENQDAANISIGIQPLFFREANSSLYWRLSHDGNARSWRPFDGRELHVFLESYGLFDVQIRMVSASGISSTVRTVHLQLEPPFYRTAAFYGVLLVLAVGLGVAAFRWYDYRRKKQLKKELANLLQEHRSLNALLNPHFVFNAINNIQHLVSQNSQRDANGYLATLSRLMRQNIQNLQQHLVPLDSELRLIDDYIALQNLRFGNRIRLTVDDETGTRHSIKLPPLTIHTFVENAMVHGYQPSQELFHIHINLSYTADHYLAATVTDNGMGLREKKAEDTDTTSERQSLGIGLMRRRLERLSRFYKRRWHVSVRNRMDDEGVSGVVSTVVLYGRFGALLKR